MFPQVLCAGTQYIVAVVVGAALYLYFVIYTLYWSYRFKQAAYRALRESMKAKENE